jgi:hypothetical protein
MYKLQLPAIQRVERQRGKEGGEGGNDIKLQQQKSEPLSNYYHYGSLLGQLMKLRAGGC